MKKDPESSPSRPPRIIFNEWTHRAPLFAVVVVLVATLFPFQFLPQETAYRRTHSFLLWLNTHPSGLRDFLENALLFVPFGFGLACWLVKKRRRGLWVAWAAGAAFSWVVEFLQVFLPTRTSSWWDVIANSIGSALGYLIFESSGGRILHLATVLAAKLEQFLTGRRILAGFVAYSSLMLFCSALLQQSTNLTHWREDDTLFVGNDASGRHPWQGRILRVEMANELVSPDYSRRAADATDQSINSQAFVAPYVLLGPTARKRQAGDDSLPAEGPRLSSKEDARIQPGFDSIRANVPATALINDLKRTNRFALRVLCIPSEAALHSFGTIVSFSHDPRHPDFYLNEDRERWVVRIRSALEGEPRYWGLDFSNVPLNGMPQEISVTYDGSDLVAAVDGKRIAQPLPLNPGASLICLFKGVGTPNVYGYGLLYDGLVFVPLGLLLAVATRDPVHRIYRRRILVTIGFLLPPLVFEIVLTLVSRRPFRVENVILGCCLILGAFLIWNADLSYTTYLPQPKTLPRSAPLSE